MGGEGSVRQDGGPGVGVREEGRTERGRGGLREEGGVEQHAV